MLNSPNYSLPCQQPLPCQFTLLVQPDNNVFTNRSSNEMPSCRAASLILRQLSFKGSLLKVDSFGVEGCRPGKTMFSVQQTLASPKGRGLADKILLLKD